MQVYYIKERRVKMSQTIFLRLDELTTGADSFLIFRGTKCSPCVKVVLLFLVGTVIYLFFSTYISSLVIIRVTRD